MVRNDNTVKYPVFGSLFFSIFIYLALFVVLFFKITQYKEEAKKYTDSLDAFMDVVVIDTQVESNTPKATKVIEEKKAKQEPMEEKKISQEVKEQTTMKEIKPPKEVKKEPIVPTKPKEEPNLQDLFKTVDTSKIKNKQEPVVEQKTQSRKKSDTETTTTKKSASELIKNLEIDQVAKTPNAQSTGIYDPFYGAINRILEQHWRAYRAQTDNSAEIEITIDKYGKFSYNIVGLSPDNEFNQKVKKFLADMKNVKFPPAPAGRDYIINTNLEDRTE